MKTSKISARLYWFPHAGSRAQSYHGFRAHFPHEVSHTFVEYPGHGARLGSPLQDMDSLIHALLSELTFADGVPFVFVGHSMGASVAFALSAALQRSQRALPCFVCVSGRNAPELYPPRSAPRTNADVIATLRLLGGTPEDVLQDPQQRTRALETARADFSVLDSFQPMPTRLSVPISACYGVDDLATRAEAMLTWAWWTERSFTLRRFAGGHFFPFAWRREFAASLLADIAAHAPAVRDEPLAAQA